MKRLSALVLSLLLVLASVLPAAAEEALIPVTMPASYVPEGFTQEVLDSVAGGTFVRGTLNADGSVTMEMTEAQRDTAKASASAAIDAAIAELVADETMTFDAIDYDESRTEFRLILTGKDVSIAEYASGISFLTLGALYSMYATGNVCPVTATFYGADGTALETMTSAQFGF